MADAGEVGNNSLSFRIRSLHIYGALVGGEGLRVVHVWALRFAEILY